MKQITLGDVAKVYWKVINCKYEDPEFQYYELGTMLRGIKDLRDKDEIDEFFCESLKSAFYSKWDQVVFDIEG